MGLSWRFKDGTTVHATVKSAWSEDGYLCFLMVGETHPNRVALDKIIDWYITDYTRSIN